MTLICNWSGFPETWWKHWHDLSHVVFLICFYFITVYVIWVLEASMDCLLVTFYLMNSSFKSRVALYDLMYESNCLLFYLRKGMQYISMLICKLMLCVSCAASGTSGFIKTSMFCQFLSFYRESRFIRRILQKENQSVTSTPITQLPTRTRRILS